MSASSVRVDEQVQAVHRPDALPLCVDLDGTLVLGDLLVESLVLLIKHKPWYLFLVPFWLLGGRARLKAEIAARVAPNAQTLPYNRKLLDWLRAQHDSGRALWLCTGTHESIAVRVAAHLQLFDGVIATDGRKNLTGSNKAACLLARFSSGGFDYCGNESADLAIWAHAHGAIVVHDRRTFVRKVARRTEVLQVFPGRPNQLREIVRALRPHQWAKNALVFVPLLTSHNFSNSQSVSAALLAAVSFCLCASSVYILNDLFDIEADRAHVRKAHRPIAAGRLSIVVGVAVVPILICAALMIASALPATLLYVLAVYLLLSVAYSFVLKRVLLVDVLTLAALYTIRIIAGAVAIAVPLSLWLLWFSMFLFLSLAFVKRSAELSGLTQQRRSNAPGRDYAVGDVPALQNLGTASGYASVLVLALYINSPEVTELYSRPAVIWLVCVLLLYWISYVWVKAQRGEMNEDPVVFALTDRVSQVVGVLALTATVIAI